MDRCECSSGNINGGFVKIKKMVWSLTMLILLILYFNAIVRSITHGIFLLMNVCVNLSFVYERNEYGCDTYYAMTIFIYQFHLIFHLSYETLVWIRETKALTGCDYINI